MGCVRWFDNYLSQPNAWFGYTPNGGVGAWNNQGLVTGGLDGRNIPGWPAAEAYDCPDDPPPYYADAHFNVAEVGYWWCPSYFIGDSYQSGSGNFWPVVCVNSQSGSITHLIVQYETECVGDPCEPVSGALIEPEEDFKWGRLSFSRTYNSLRQLPDITAMGPAWSHSLGIKMWVGSNTNYAFVRGQRNEIEEFYQQTADVFWSMNLPGSSLTKQVVGGVTTWIKRNKAGEQWVFDANGVLTAMNFPDQPADNLTFAYCDSTSYSNGICAVPGQLISALDGRGRLLTFEYRPALYTADTVPVYVPARLIDVRSDTGILVSYDYDDQGMLWEATYPNTGAGATRTYLYGESANICVDANGNPITPCSPSVFAMLLTGTLDEFGNRYLNVTYGADARVTSSSLPNGAGKFVLSYSITPGTMPIPTATLADGETRTYKFGNQLFSKLGDYTVVGNGATYLTQHSYYPTGWLQQLTDANGNVSQFAYDNYHETSRTEAFGKPEQRTTQTTWDNNINRVTSLQVSNASATLEKRSDIFYNTQGQIAARCDIDPSDPLATSYVCSDTTAPVAGAKVRRWVYAYCTQADVTAAACPVVGLLKSINGPRLATEPSMGGLDDLTGYTYYQTDDSTCASGGACTHRRGDLWKITNALSQVTTYVSYDKDGRVTRMLDANGTATDFQYHPRGWLTDRIVRASALSNGPGDAITHIDYDLTGSVTKVTQPDDAYLSYAYDDAHRLIKITDNLGDAIDYCPGGIGGTDCLDNTGNRRIEQIKDPSQTIKRTSRRVYDQLGHLQKVLNAANLPTFDATNGYDGKGNLTLSTDGLGYQTQQTYDGLDRLVKTLRNYNGTDPATSNTETDDAYDTRDNLRQVTDPDGLSTVYGFDGLNNQISLSSPDTGVWSYQTDLAGNRTDQTDARAIDTGYKYDALNRLVATKIPSSSITYAYDQANATTGCATSFPIGRLTNITDGSGNTTYCYDRRGNVITKKQVTGSATLITQYTYTNADRIASITYPSGNLVTFGRDAVGHVSTVSVKIGSTTATLVSNATYYPFGPLNVLTFGNGRTLTKTYDQDYAIDQIAASVSGGLSLNFSVDVMGDIIDYNNTSRTYTYDPLYRLTSSMKSSAPMEQYTYNKTGDRLSAALNNGAPTSYTYTTGTHHLASVGAVARTYDANGNTQSGVATGYTFGYDDKNRLATATGSSSSAVYVTNGRGERVRKDVTSGTTVTTLYSYDEGGTLLGEYSAAGAAQAEYIYLDRTPIGVVNGTTLSYIETDHLGTPRQVINPANNVAIWSWAFISNAFGASAPNQDPDGNGTAFVLNLRFPGQYYDAETGLEYNYFRDYEPLSGRYVESDPIGLKGGISTYAYVSNKPLTASDAKGLTIWTFRWGIGGGVGYYGVGASVYNLNVNDPIRAKSCNYTVYCGGPGAGLPEFGLISAPMKWDDGKSCSSCNQFSGYGSQGFASFVVGIGWTIAGWLDVPNGPTIKGEFINNDLGAFRIGLGVNICRFSLN